MPGTSLDTSSSSSEDESFSRDLETTWSSNVTQEIIQQLTEAEKKRQEIINGEYFDWTDFWRTFKKFHRNFLQNILLIFRTF